MRKFTIAGLAIGLALILSLDTPRPVAAATGTPASLTTAKEYYRQTTGLHDLFLLGLAGVAFYCLAVRRGSPRRSKD